MLRLKQRRVTSCMQAVQNSWSGDGTGVLLAVEDAELAVGCPYASGMTLRRRAAAFALVGAVLVVTLSQGAAVSDRDAHLARQAAAKVRMLCSLTACQWDDSAQRAGRARKAFSTAMHGSALRPLPSMLSSTRHCWLCVQANPREAFGDWVRTFQKTYSDGLKVS